MELKVRLECSRDKTLLFSCSWIIFFILNLFTCNFMLLWESNKCFYPQFFHRFGLHRGSLIYFISSNLVYMYFFLYFYIYICLSPPNFPQSPHIINAKIPKFLLINVFLYSSMLVIRPSRDYWQLDQHLLVHAKPMWLHI